MGQGMVATDCRFSAPAKSQWTTSQPRLPGRRKWRIDAGAALRITSPQKDFVARKFIRPEGGESFAWKMNWLKNSVGSCRPCRRLSKPPPVPCWPVPSAAPDPSRPFPRPCSSPRSTLFLMSKTCFGDRRSLFLVCELTSGERRTVFLGCEMASGERRRWFLGCDLASGERWSLFLGCELTYGDRRTVFLGCEMASYERRRRFLGCEMTSGERRSRNLNLRQPPASAAGQFALQK